MNDSKPKQETYEDYERNPIACGYTLIEKNGEQFYSKTIKGDGYTVIVNRPVLTPEDKSKREKQVMDTVVNVYKEVYRSDPELADRLFTRKVEEE